MFDKIKLSADLRSIFTEVFKTDIGTKRKGFPLKVTAPVHKENIAMWESLSKHIVKLVNYVTQADSDSWEIQFVSLNSKEYYLKPLYKDLKYSNVSLLSGGIDSYCGAFENIISGAIPIYCGYKTTKMDTSRINRVLDFIGTTGHKYDGITFDTIDVKKVHAMQRTRSLLFFSLAVQVAVVNDISVINIYENGIMTLNPSFQSRGTTKTTHPKTIKLYQEIVDTIGLDLKLAHPFLFQTKGQMVSTLSDIFKSNLNITRSCSKPPIAIMSAGKTSCGECVPCLLRKISMAAYDMERFDHCDEYLIPYAFNGDSIDYRSSLEYYKTFNRAIKDKTIFTQMDMRKSYYEDPDYLVKTKAMLQTFSDEVDVFLSKYAR